MSYRNLHRLRCPNCGYLTKLQANLEKDIEIVKGAVPFPENNIFHCQQCKTRHDLSSARRQIELQVKKKIV